MRIILIFILLILSVNIPAFCIDQFGRDELSYDNVTGMWAYTGGNLTPLCDNLPKNDYNTAFDKNHDMIYQMQTYSSQNPVMQDRYGYSQRQENVSDSSSENNREFSKNSFSTVDNSGEASKNSFSVAEQ